MLNLVFLLDITGSMSAELDGVKKTVARLVETVFTDYANTLIVTLITFTESEKGCYVTRESFADGHEAAQYVNKIKLCVPPGMPSVNAHGGDGPENHKAALAELTRLDGDVPTIAFLITDAIPHMLDRRSTEAVLESNYLSQEYGITDADLFSLLHTLHAHFDDNLILNVVKYYNDRDHALYGAVAKGFNGVLITPQQRAPERLADGLMAILLQMFRAISGDATGAGAGANPVNDAALQAFSFYDLTNVEVPASEQLRGAIVAPHLGSTDELLYKLVERTTVIAGGKFKKRAITAHLVSEQVELMLVMAKGLLRGITKEEAVERATLLLSKIKTLMGEEHASQFKLKVEELEGLLANESFASAEGHADIEAAVSAITLMSIEETARELKLEGEVEEDEPEPRDPYSALLEVASLFLGHLAVLELPTRLGVVDFMDAWSATIKKVSNDVVTAADFLQMIGDKESVAGLRLREREYNFLQLMADPTDAVGSELLRIASGTQVLDILTALLSGAPAGLFSPNMFRGTISACLMTMLSTHGSELSEYQWTIAHKMVHTMRLVMAATPKTLELEPESAMGKLLFRLVRLTKGKRVGEVEEPALRSFLEEMAAARAMKFAKYNESGYLALVEEMAGYSHDTAATTLDAFAPHVLIDGGDELALDAAHAAAVVGKSEFCQAFERCAGNVLRAVFPDEKPVSLAQVWPAYTHDLPKLLLLQKRTERYTLESSESTDSVSDKTWTRNSAVMAASLTGEDAVFRAKAMALLRVKYDAFVRAVRRERQDLFAQERWRKIVAFMRSPAAEFTPKLSMIVRDDACREHKLLLKAFKLYGHELEQSELEAKLVTVITGRDLATGTIVFNRGNLHPHPDRFVPLSRAFKATLRELQRTNKWSTAHVYRASGLPNHSGHSNAKPSAWAVNRAGGERSFWDEDA